jgi:trehalose 6-phosphate synthase
MAALDPEREQGRRRMSRLHRQVLDHDVHRWAQSFLGAL